jgi:hypothetical protein
MPNKLLGRGTLEDVRCSRRDSPLACPTSVILVQLRAEMLIESRLYLIRDLQIHNCLLLSASGQELKYLS